MTAGIVRFFSSHRWLSIICALIVVICAYVPVFFGYYQQDEWFAFGLQIVKLQQSYLTNIIGAFAPDTGHYVPLHYISLLTLYKLFGIAYTPYAVVNIAGHVLTSLMVYVIAKKIAGHNFGLLTMVIFGLLSSIYQAVAWPMANLNTPLATFFGLYSLFFIHSFSENRKQKYLFLSILFCIVSLFFKETTVALICLVPLFYHIFSKKHTTLINKTTVYFLIVGFIYVIARIIFIIISKEGSSVALVTETQPIGQLIYNFITFPIKSTVQLVISTEVLIKLSHVLASFLPQSISGQAATTARDIFVMERVFEVVNLVAFLVFVGILVKVAKTATLLYKKIFFFGLLFIILNSFVIAFSPERTGIIGIVDSRNLYLLAFGMSLVISGLYQHISKKRQPLALLFISLFILANFYFLEKNLFALAESGRMRKYLLYEVQTKFPDLPERVVFLSLSDSTYYGLPEKETILPFQSGFGQTLLVSYYSQKLFPYQFFLNKFLWGITATGYQEDLGRGFGYFRNFNEMIVAFENYKLPPESLFAFSYSAKFSTIKDITPLMRGAILGYRVDKRQIPSSQLHISSSENKLPLQTLTDSRRETVWDSGLAYSKFQYIDIDLLDKKTVAQVKIDAYNSPDQEKTGYRVLVSEDAKRWETIFEARRFPPEGGFVNIYFQPTSARYIRIVQIGTHETAHWLVHEIEIYETAN